jgi:LPS-assembly protein
LHLGRVGWILLLLSVVAVPAWPSAAQAQTLNERLAARSQSKDGDKLLVDAREIVYDNDRNTVSAVGDVQVYYQGRVLQADKVTYDRNANRVLAEGNARLTETDGTVATGDRFELTDDFKDGFIDTLRVETADKTRFSAPRAERTAGESTVFERGTYTACEACKKDPTRPPLWQVKAAKIIHNNSERMIYYEDATVEFYGIPLAYIPYFSAPDPTVKRKTGFLAPRYIYSGALGYGGSTPFFWAIAPDYDLTLTPTFLSQQGFLGQAEWRQRFLTGSYNIRAAGIFQQDPNAFLAPPYGARNKDFRGSIESSGRFNINTQWAWGWDIALMTDKWFFNNYKIHSESLTSTFFNESTSTVYLTGRSDTGFFDARGYYFRTLSYDDWQKQQPVVYPTIDYNKRLQAPGRIGGEIAIDANITHLSRSAAQYQQVPGSINATFPVGSPYETCTIFNRAECLVRGIGGDYSRLSVGVTWQREFVDPLGQVWKPFAGLRVDGFSTQLNTTSYQNAEISNFLNPDDNIAARFMPTVGLEYRYPFVATTQRFGTHILEPIAQIVVRPNEMRAGELPNEDSQSLVFDDTNLFEWNKFSGYDRVEGGVRANIGAKYSVTTDTGGYGDILFGQSYQLAGENSYAQSDIAHVGLNSGLQESRSDYVGRLHYAPNDTFSFTGRGRFDNDTFALERLELQSKADFGRVSASAMYARYAAQPELGYPYRREGLLTSANFKLTDRWSLNGSVLFDLDRYLTERQNYAYAGLPIQQSNRWSVASVSVGALYQDECTTFGVTYVSNLKDGSQGTNRPDKTIMLRLELRTLGEVSFSQNISSEGSTDGISN